MPIASVPPRPQAVATAVVHDARAVHDLASLQFGEFETDGKATWIVAEITPGERSGAATVPGASYDAKKGQLTSPPGTQTVVINEGIWKAVAASPSEAQHEKEKYNWSEPLDQRNRMSGPQDFYSPFVSGGVILFRPNWSETGRAQFALVCLLFSAWAKDAPKAFAFAEQHPGLLGGIPAAVPDVPALNKGVSGSNLVVAALSFRQLLLLGLLTPEAAREDLSRAKGNLDAIFTYLILTNPSADNDKRLMAAVDSIIRATEEPAKLRALSLGAFAAALFSPRDPKITSPSKSILGAIGGRLKNVQPDLPKDPYLLYIFETMNIAH